MSKNNKNIAKKILNIVLDILIVLLGIILIITIYNNIQVKILGNDYASFFGYSVFEVQTGSMEPEISAGDWIIVKYDKTIELNDIVTFEHKGNFITHRIIESYNGTYVTKGDANTAKDSPINKNQIVGTVSKILPNFGILRKTVFNPIVLIFLIITCYIGMQAFKKPTEKEIAMEQELLDKIKNKVNKTKKNKKESKEEKTTETNIEITEIEENKEEKEKQEETEQKEIKEEQEVVEETNENVEETLPFDNQDEMEKTIFYRMVSVSEDELSSAYNTPVMVEEDIEAPKKEEEVIDVSESEVKMTLELIQKKKRRCRNFIEKAISIKEEEIEKIINIILQNEKNKTNEPTIKDNFIKSYVDAKYYNYCGEINLEYNAKNMNTRIEEAIKEIAENMKKKYKGSDNNYKEKVDKYSKLILLVNRLEQDYKKEETIEEKKETYKKRIEKYYPIEIKEKDFKILLSRVIKAQKKYSSIIKFLLNKLETGMFELKFNQLKEKNTYAVELQHNLQFSKVYSEYIVDKTYSEGIVAEDKVEVLASLLQAQLVKDMYNGVFDKKYIVYIPETLYEKDKKLDKVLNYFNNPYAKNTINFLIKFEALNKNKKTVRTLVKAGYHFSTDLTNVEKLKRYEETNLHIMDYIFISKTKANSKNKLDIVPEALKAKVVLEDIAFNVGNF